MNNKCFLIVFLFLLGACSEQSVLDYGDGATTNACKLSKAEAESIIHNSSCSLDGASLRGVFSLLKWNLAYKDVSWTNPEFYYNRLNEQDCVELDFDSGYFIQFYRVSRFSNPHFLDSSQKLLVVRDRKTGKTGTFIKIVVIDKTNIIKVYTRLDGRLVCLEKYEKDRLVQSVFFPYLSGRYSGSEIVKVVRRILDGIMIKRAASNSFTKSTDDGDTVEWNLLIDSASVCVADTSDTLAVDYTLDPIDENWDPYDPDLGYDDLNPGSGGGGYVGTGGSPGTGDYGNASITVNGKTVQVKYLKAVETSEKTAFEQKLGTLADIPVFKSIVSNLDFSRISVSVVSDGMEDYVSGETVASYSQMQHRYVSAIISLNINGNIYGYLEEFFHADQYLNSGSTSKLLRGDVEFEAKLLLASIFRDFSDKDYQLAGSVINDQKSYFKAIYNYYTNPNLDTRIAAMGAFAHLGYLGYEMSYEGAELDNYLNNILHTYHKYYN